MGAVPRLCVLLARPCRVFVVARPLASRGLIIRLGIIKEMQPLYVATYSEKPAVLEGHPFIVEAGVSLGGAEASGPVQLDRWS